MMYLQCIIGVDSVARFLACYNHRSDRLDAAKRMHENEVLCRTGNLKALCDDNEKARERQIVDTPPLEEVPAAAAAAAACAESGNDMATVSEPDKRRASKDYFTIAKQLIKLLNSDEGENPVDVANNAVDIDIPLISICQALSAWIASWTVLSERLLAELGMAFRSPKRQNFILSSDEQAVVFFLRTLSARGGEYTNASKELCLMLTVQAINDVEQEGWQKGWVSAQALAFALATFARELDLGTRPVYTFAAEMLTRCAVIPRLRNAALLVVETAIAAWPEAFVPLPDDYFVHALCFILHDNSTQEKELLKQIVATCHWRVATKDQLVQALVNPVTIKSFASISLNDEGELFVHVTNNSSMQCWFCTICMLASNLSDFTSLLKAASVAFGKATEQFITCALSSMNLS